MSTKFYCERIARVAREAIDRIDHTVRPVDGQEEGRVAGDRHIDRRRTGRRLDQDQHLTTEVEMPNKRSPEGE